MHSSIILPNCKIPTPNFGGEQIVEKAMVHILLIKGASRARVAQSAHSYHEIFPSCNDVPDGSPVEILEGLVSATSTSISLYQHNANGQLG
ncbi:hypothetical protein LINPERPRIM_LOCUS40447 [Linum perenne]